MRAFHDTLLGTSVILAVVCLSGCGPSRGIVKGKVTFQDKPVDYGSVVFIGPNNELVQAQLKPDGTYSAAGVAYGHFKVEVYSLHADKPVGPTRKTDDGEEAPPKQGPAPAASKGVVIPEDYNDKDKSGLSLTIEQRITEYNIELKEKK